VHLQGFEPLGSKQLQAWRRFRSAALASKPSFRVQIHVISFNHALKLVETLLNFANHLFLQPVMTVGR
jgi:hypothetical protein